MVKFSFENVTLSFVLALIGLTLLSLLGQFFGFETPKAGIFLLLIAVLVASILGIRIVSGSFRADRAGILQMLLIAGLLIAAIIFVPKIAPELFSVQAANLQSIIAFP